MKSIICLQVRLTKLCFLYFYVLLFMPAYWNHKIHLFEGSNLWNSALTDRPFIVGDRVNNQLETSMPKFVMYILAREIRIKLLF
jgi:hypothetical protein